MAKSTKRPAVGERREQILGVALRLFAQHGMAHVTTRQIAQAVGISQPSLYAHFRTADEIGEELCVRAFGVLYGRFEHVLAQASDPARRLRALGRAYIEFGLEHPDMYRIAFMLEDTHEHSQDPHDPLLSTGMKALEALRLVIVELRGRDDEAAAVQAQSIWACVHGLTSLLLARSDFPWAERKTLIDHHLDFISAAAAAMRQ